LGLAGVGGERRFKLLLTLPQRVRPTITKWDCLANDI
jgi:hypothetical protein